MEKLRSLLFNGKYRRPVLVCIDILMFLVVDLFHYLLAGRASHSTPVSDAAVYFLNSLILCVLIFAVRGAFRVYHHVWRYTNTKAYFMTVVSDGVAGVAALLLSRVINELFYPGFYVGIWHFVTVASLTALLTLMSRFTYRLVYKRLNLRSHTPEDAAPKTPIAIIGAGQLGAYLAAELLNSANSVYDPKCFVDDDKRKVGLTVAGLPIYSVDGGSEIIKKLGINEVVIAIANITKEKTEFLWKHYQALGCKVKIYESPLAGESAGADGKRVVRDFEIEDLLFRSPLTFSGEEELSFYRGKTVLVTGGGGSIGSELCRQLIKHGLKKLIIFDIYENNAYDIQQEIKRNYGESVDLAVEIGSVRDVDRLECVFSAYKPQIVFHAAAHKHVPLMEHSACEAIKNNVMGTYNTANAAERHGAEKFILISTDKAVNPTNIMGASKRLCEMVVQCRTDSATSFAAVRFGNVLGSNGSVIPLFKRQIAAGGPVTITDKRIIRYFMTIPEASQLVILAGAKAKKGELFVLDMGRPVRIYDLAVNMIRMMGYEPEKDIKIEEIGLRPGEKLYEELLMKNEELIKTDNEMIFIEKDTPYTRQEIEEKLSILNAAVRESQCKIGQGSVKAAIKATVPTFIDPEEANRNADESEEMKTANAE